MNEGTTIHITPENRQALKLESVKRNITMQTLANEIIASFFNANPVVLPKTMEELYPDTGSDVAMKTETPVEE